MRHAILFVALLGATSLSAETVLDFQLGAGVKSEPGYFGAANAETSPALTFRLRGARAFGREFGGDPSFGLSSRGSVRVIGARKASDHEELTGLEDVDPAIEIGFGLRYEAPNYRVFSSLRQGMGGHMGQVLELGADVKFAPVPELELSAGPRVIFGSDNYVQTYFGVTGEEAAQSDFTAYGPNAGLVSTGARLSAEYSLGQSWSVLGEVQHEVLRGDVADSPIVSSDRSTGASVSLVRNFALRF